MTDRASLPALARAALLPAACLAIIAYFAFHAVSGNAGLLAWQDAKVHRTRVETRAATVAAEKATLTRQVALLDPRHVDRDIADEYVRRDLGVVRADEVIVPLPPITSGAK